MRFLHFGVAVASIEAGIASYRDLFGYRLTGGPFVDPIQQVSVAFMAQEAGEGPALELVAPASDASPVNRYLAKGGGPYHLCFEVDDLAAATARLAAGGCMAIADPAPAVAFGGRRIAWLYSPLRQLVELVEAGA